MSQSPKTRTVPLFRLPKRVLNRCLIPILTGLIGVTVLFAQTPQDRPRSKLGEEFGPVKVNDGSVPASDSEIAVFRNQASVIVWNEWDETGTSIHWQKLNKIGAAVGPSAKANESANAGLFSPDVATAENNCFSLVWMESLEGTLACSPCNGRYWIREYKADGMPYDPGENQVNVLGNWMEGPPIITAADTLDWWPSGLLPNVPWGITWQPDEETYQENTHFSSYFWGYWDQQIRLDPYVAPNRPVGISATSPGDEFIVFYVRWMDNNWASYRARKVDIYSNLIGDPMAFQIPAGSLVMGESATLNDLDQVGVAWIEQDANGSEVWFQGYKFIGNSIVPYGDAELVQSTTEFVRHVAIASSNNRFVVAWSQAEGIGLGDLSAVYVRRVFAGYPGGDLPIRVDNDPATADSDPSIALIGNYSYVSWTKSPEGSTKGDIYAAKVDMGPEL